ncbi:Pycsar system effector family protein [Dactylosporangium sucinum]|uniref:Pycsar effector protein domain-containing protein n=1 Tax=Dactylosporangium sucinum TaxID=1424081 RepID=A0A917TI12_9ACTN|nr:Pycsar system effector family protein [Dactylosporangium sucinum]GGM23150.1 hypothetical protein GCM10007977_025460 [Dactylosporangium sucinum]
MPDPGDPTTELGIHTFTTKHTIPTAGGAAVDILAAAAPTAVSTWTCSGCGETGADSLVAALLSAGGHASQCGRGTVPTRLTEAVAAVGAELKRVDSKASTLLTLAGAALTVVLAMISRTSLPAVAGVAGWVCVALIGLGIALLASAVRPSFNGDHGFIRYADADDADDVLARLTSDPADPAAAQREHAQQLHWLSRAVRTKYRRVRLAVDLLVAGVGAAALTVALATML